MAPSDISPEDISERTQREIPSIVKSLEVEQLDPTLFRSTSLHRPWRARGVYGGHVISQALVSATRSVDEVYHLHSMHCYFILSASPAIPILYYVERLRDGKTYCTRSVKAVQNGKVVFTLLCSFQKPEPHQPSHQLSLPITVPRPDKCQSMADRFRAAAEEPGLHPKRKAACLELAHERDDSNIEVLCIPEVDGTYRPGIAGVHESYRLSPDGTKVFMWWMKARDLPQCEAAMQKCILGYMSDLNFIGIIPTMLGLKRLDFGSKALGMLSSLDHSIYYYDDDFNCGDWILYVMTSTRSGSGRGVAHGRMYTQSGSLIAVLSQEGVVRQGIDRPAPPTAKL